MISRLFIIEPTNGLCNRLRAIASGYILAKHLKREFKIVWHATKDIGYAKFEHLFQNIELILDKMPAKSASVYTAGIRTEMGLLKEIMSDNNDIVILKQTGGNYKLPNMTIREFNTLKSEFYNCLKPIESIQQRITLFANKYKLDECTGVQIRRTDRKNITPPTEMFAIAIKRALTAKVFLTTDDPFELKKLKKNILKNIQIIMYQKKQYGRNNIMCVQEALIEWTILSMCKTIIYSQSSSFGYEACIPYKLGQSVELRQKREKTENEKRNLPQLIFNE